MATRIILRGLTASVSLLCLAPAAVAKNTQYIYGTSIDGITRQLAVDRTPALYTGNFGDCSEGQGLFNIIKFDAAVSLNPSRVSSLIMFKRNATGQSTALPLAYSKFHEASSVVKKKK